jgi:hypothetical protein
MPILISHNGNFTHVDVERVISQIEQLNELPTTIRKISYLAVEVLQNIIHHSDNNRMSYFSLSSGSDCYVIKSGNLIKIENKETLFKKLTSMDMLTPDEVKKEIKLKLQEECFSCKGGAGLGLLSIKKKAGSFTWEIEVVDNQWNLVHFTITV